MPILPESPADLHRYRHIAESFGEDPARYDRARPTYPAPLIERVIAASPGRDFLDVGIGTGISARLFQAAGCNVLGIEVDQRMADYARQKGTEVEISTFEAWNPANRTFDAVTAGQSWHWIDPEAGAAKAARILRPGGLFAAFWNVHQPEPDAAEAFAEITSRLAPELPNAYGRNATNPRMYAAYRDRAAPALVATKAFTEPATWLFEWQSTYTRDAWLDVVPTHGGFSQLPPERAAGLLAALGAAIDDLGGSIEVNYTTVAVTATRFPSSPVRGEPDDPSAE